MLAAEEELCDESVECELFVQMGAKDFRASRGKSVSARRCKDQKPMWHEQKEAGLHIYVYTYIYHQLFHFSLDLAVG